MHGSIRATVAARRYTRLRGAGGAGPLTGNESTGRLCAQCSQTRGLTELAGQAQPLRGRYSQGPAMTGAPRAVSLGPAIHLATAAHARAFSRGASNPASGVSVGETRAFSVDWAAAFPALGPPHASEPTSEFPFVWLRDHCSCPQCIHTSTRQKLHSSAAIPAGSKPSAWRIVDSPLSHGALAQGASAPALHVTWAPASLETPSGAPLTPEATAHESIYPLVWLRDHAHVAVWGASLEDQTQREALAPKLWKAADLHPASLTFAYDDVMASPSTLVAVLEALSARGLVFVKGVPTKKDSQVEDLAVRVGGQIRDTFYGRSWDVKNEKVAKNIAYTDLSLSLHMDLMYFEAPPGLQFLHSLKNSVQGGESTFADCFQAVATLRESFPEHYEILTSIPITYHYHNNARWMTFTRPVIHLSPPPGADLNVVDPLLYTRVYYSPPFQSVIHAAAADLPRFYEAIKALTRLIEAPDMVHQTLLQPGTCAIFANRRVLHGRNRFFPSSVGDGGSRHFRGTYCGADEFFDRLRVLRET